MDLDDHNNFLMSIMVNNNNNNITATSSSKPINVSSAASRLNSIQMPYNLRKHKEPNKPPLPQTSKTTLIQHQQKVIKSSNNNSVKPPIMSSSSCSVYSSSSASTSPSPSPSYSSTSSTDSNNNANQLLKQHQSLLINQISNGFGEPSNDLFSFEDLITINNNNNTNNDLNDETIVNTNHINNNTPILNKTNITVVSSSSKSILNKTNHNKTPVLNNNLINNKLSLNNRNQHTSLFNKQTPTQLFSSNNKNRINTITNNAVMKSISHSAQSTITTRSKLKRQAAVDDQPVVTNKPTRTEPINITKNKNHLVTSNLKLQNNIKNINNLTTQKSQSIKQITNNTINNNNKIIKPILHHANSNNNNNNNSNNQNDQNNNGKKIKKKKRVSVINKFKPANEMNVDDASDYSDNDDTSDSSTDEDDETLMLPAPSSTTSITTTSVTNSTAKKIVSFATNTTTTTTTTSNKIKSSNLNHQDHNNKTGRTPPHRKFRKLRLFDTAYTPKTLMKKAVDALKTDMANKQDENTNTNTKIIETKKTETFISTQNHQDTNHQNFLLDQSPPHNNQLFKSSILSNVNQTPKSLRRTPLKQHTAMSSAMRLNLSPPSTHDIEMQESYESSRSSSSMSNRITTTTTTSTRLRLFESTNTKTNKTLNFDDSDDETCIASNKQQAVTTDEEMQYLFEQPKSVPNTYSSHQSLFKPINKMIHSRLNNSNSLQSISTLGFSSRSPNSPFLIGMNQQQNTTNINPFTPTNLYDNSKLTSASNAAIIAKSYLTNSQTPHLLKQQQKQSSLLLKDSTLKSSSLQQLPTIQSMKRCFDYSTSSNQINEISQNQENEIESSANNDLNNSIGCQQQSISKDEHSNSLPRNKRLALRQCLVSRYHEEFHEVCKLGSGEFGDVFKCINRLDGCTYAIKRSKKAIVGGSLEVAAWKEVCAHAALGQHHHIVQYYSAWAECDRMLIQNEYCNGGSLAEFIESLKSNCDELNMDSEEGGSMSIQSNMRMNEADLKILLLHIAKGLAYMHSKNLAHLDIKPGNIFICRTPRRHNLNLDLGIGKKSTTINSTTMTTTIVNGIVINEESGIESEEIDDDEPGLLCGTKNTDENNVGSSLFSEVITYKIGDLGHVTSTLEPHVEEGDCRYLPNEILQEQYNHLVKADIFALALTVFVSGSLEELPKNGDEWHWIRQGNLKDLPQCSDRFKKLLLVSL